MTDSLLKRYQFCIRDMFSGWSSLMRRELRDGPNVRDVSVGLPILDINTFDFMNKFISESDIKALAEKEATQSKAEREWERVRGTGVGEIIGSATKDISVSSQPSLFDQLKKRDEESATEEEANSRNAGLPKMLDEDEARFFDEQKRREREESRKLEFQVDQFKRAAALASANTKPDLPIIPGMPKKQAPVSNAKRFSPIGKLVPIKDSSDNSSDSSLKKRSVENTEVDAPSAKKPKLEPDQTSLTGTTAKTTSAQKPSLVKYSRRDDDE